MDRIVDTSSISDSVEIIPRGLYQRLRREYPRARISLGEFEYDGPGGPQGLGESIWTRRASVLADDQVVGTYHQTMYVDGPSSFYRFEPNSQRQKGTWN